MAFSLCCLINPFTSQADDENTFFQSASQNINQQQSMSNNSFNTAFSNPIYKNFFTPQNIIKTYHEPPQLDTCPHTCPITNQCNYNQGQNLGSSYSFDIYFDVIAEVCEEYNIPQPPNPRPHLLPPAVPPQACTANILFCPGTQTQMPRDPITCRWQPEKCVTNNPPPIYPPTPPTPPARTCAWDVNNLIPPTIDTTGIIQICDIRNLGSRNTIDGSVCSQNGAACVSPWIERASIEIQNGADPNAKVNKLFRCACTSSNGSPGWDFQRYAISGEQGLASCPAANSLPGNKVDNSSCNLPDARCISRETYSLGRKVFRCNPSINRTGSRQCRLDLNNLVSQSANLPICPMDSNNNVNNVDCSSKGEGWTCKRSTPETFTFGELRGGWKKIFRCDCL